MGSPFCRLDSIPTIEETEWARRESQKSIGRSVMPLAFMEHFLIQSADIEKTKDWWVNVLGMRVGPSPDFKFPVYWLYIGDKDVLHLTQGGANVSDNRM